MAQVYFISGIDTDAGKSYATGWLARRYMERGLKVVTMKFIQTGCVDFSEDIAVHRSIMGTGDLDDDTQHLTAPIDLGIIDEALRRLAERYDVVLIEGAGGLMVPITDDFFAIDYPRTRGLEVILVTNSRLGSINHTVLSLEAIRSRGMRLHSVLYNKFFDSDRLISADTRGFVGRYVERYFPGVEVIDVPVIEQ